MEEENTRLELSRLYCRSLNPFNFFCKPALYATVSLVSETGDRVSDQHCRTDTDKVGGCNPNWGGSSFSLDIVKSFLEPEVAVSVKFEVFCHGRIILPDRKVGEVRVALKELVDDFNGVDRFQERRVRGHGTNAALHFAYKLVNGSKIKNDGAAPAGCKMIYFAPSGSLLSVENIVMAPARQVRRCHSAAASGSGFSSAVPYDENSYLRRGGSTVAAEINGDGGSDGGDEIKEEGVLEEQSITGLQLTGYGCQLDHSGGSFYGTRSL